MRFSNELLGHVSTRLDEILRALRAIHGDMAFIRGLNESKANNTGGGQLLLKNPDGTVERIYSQREFDDLNKNWSA